MTDVRGAWGYKIAAVTGCLVALAGCTTQPPVLPDQMPAPFKRALRYTSEMLVMKEPGKILNVFKLENEARLADARPAVLLVGPQLLSATDPIELVFRLGRALSLNSSGRVAAVARTGRHLRPAFLAAVFWMARTVAPAAG